MRKWQGALDDHQDPNLTHELLALEGPANGGPAWEVKYALLRAPDGTVISMPGWPPPDPIAGTLSDLWGYWADKGGGNGYSQEVAWYRTRPEYAEEAVQYIDAVLHAEGHPLGFDPAALAQSHSQTKPNRPNDQPADEEASHENADERDPGWYVPEPLADILVWQVASQLIRRHPKELWAINTFPLDGFYNCLAVCDVATMGERLMVHLNRLGTSAAVPASGLMRWSNTWEAEDAREWLLRLEERMGLEAPRGTVPASTRASLAVRWVAQFMSMQLSARTRWRSFGGLGPEDQRPEVLRTADVAEDPRYWRLGHIEDGWKFRPIVWVSIQGHLTVGDRPPIDLMAARGPREPISALIVKTVPNLLP